MRFNFLHEGIVGGLFNAVASLVIAIGLCYFMVWAVLGIREKRAAERNRGPLPPPSDRHVYFLIPCLNEELVIGNTVAGLVGHDHPNMHVIVVDDASSDRTTEVALAVGDPRVRVHRRELPDARQGKGEALNAGFQLVLADVDQRGLDPSQVVICVMDADGRLSQDALRHVLPMFDDERIGGLQLAVKIRTTRRFITRVQDFEFWGLSAVSQFARRRSATVSLGGNGQFTRLSALLTVSTEPWSKSLTEDLDLALMLMARGWRLDTAMGASVDQQGVGDYKRLVRQRTRWFQGHMTCGKRLWELWSSPKVSTLAIIEATLYLSVPWVLVLPWSILFHIALIETGSELAHNPNSFFGTTALSWFVFGTFWYLVSFGPCLVMGYLYYRQDKTVGLLNAIFLGHLLLAWNYIAYYAAWSALFRMITRRRGWEKTARSADAEGASAFQTSPPELETVSATVGSRQS